MVGEVFDLRLEEMPGHLGQDSQETAIGNRSDLADFLMMLFDEPQVRKQGGKIVPAGEGFSLYKQAVQFSFLLQVGIDLLCLPGKILNGKFSLRRNGQDFRGRLPFYSKHDLPLYDSLQGCQSMTGTRGGRE